MLARLLRRASIRKRRVGLSALEKALKPLAVILEVVPPQIAAHCRFLDSSKSPPPKL